MELCTPLDPHAEAGFTLEELARTRSWAGFELARLWSELVSGRWKIASLVNGLTRVYLHVREKSDHWNALQ